MNFLHHILSTISGEGQLLSLQGFVVAVSVYLVLSWLICVSAAFLKVREVHFYVGMLSLGLSLVVALLVSGICRIYFPEFAASFTQGEVFLGSALAGILVCSVPAIQYFWNVSYWRGLACMTLGFLILMGSMMVFQVLASPNESIQARFSVPLLQKGIPGLSL